MENPEQKTSELTPILVDTDLLVISNGRGPIISMKMAANNLETKVHQPESIDEATKIFFENLKLHGQSIVDRAAKAESFQAQIIELSRQNPNDMEFGNVVRRTLLP